METGWTNSVPPPGTEVFIGKIPQDIYEDKLIPVFQSVGKLYEFRLMMTFSGLNRGFAYAKYMNRRNAQEAIVMLNNFEIQPGHPILVCRSTDKCELCIDGLASSVKEHQLLLMLQELTTGAVSISLHPSPYKKQRQLAEVKYASHQAAAVAKKSLVEGSLCLLGDEIEVDWLKPSIKQQLHKGVPEVLPFSSAWREAPSQGPPEPEDCPMLSAEASVVDYLKLECKKRQLGSPQFYTRCVKRNPEGSLLFWYHVTIPKCLSPFSGFIWIKPDDSRLRDYEKVKNTVALQVLQVLAGVPVV